MELRRDKLYTCILKTLVVPTYSKHNISVVLVLITSSELLHTDLAGMHCRLTTLKWMQLGLRLNRQLCIPPSEIPKCGPISLRHWTLSAHDPSCSCRGTALEIYDTRSSSAQFVFCQQNNKNSPDLIDVAKVALCTC